MTEKLHGIGFRQVRNIRKGDMIRCPESGVEKWSSAKANAPISSDPFVSIVVQRPTPDLGKWITTTVSMFQLDLVEIQVELKNASNFSIGVAIPLGFG